MSFPRWSGRLAADPATQSDLLLSNDQTFSLQGIPGDSQLQFGLCDFEGVNPKTQPRRNYRLRPSVARSIDALEVLYEERAAGRLSTRSIQTYRWLRRDILALGSKEAARAIHMLDLFSDEQLLGRVLVSGRLADGRICSKSTVAHRRTAIRSVATIVGPELRKALGCDPHAVIRRALRAVAERRGSGYRIDAGSPRTHGGPTPTEGELLSILEALQRAEGWLGARDRAFGSLLASTASRFSAMRMLDGTDCHVLPNGRIRLLLHQKNGKERHEVELDGQSATALLRYIEVFNQSMKLAGRPDRIRLGEPAPIWRTPRGGRTPEKIFRETLRRACEVAGTPDYTPHAFRRQWATAAAGVLPRWEAALGGGWRGTERFDASYVSPNRSEVWAKLGGVGQPGDDVEHVPRVATNVPAVIP